MGARQKLNGSYFLGSLAIACLIGYLTESALGLLVSLAVLLGINVKNGDIRLHNRRDHLTKNRRGHGQDCLD